MLAYRDSSRLSTHSFGTGLMPDYHPAQPSTSELLRTSLDEWVFQAKF